MIFGHDELDSGDQETPLKNANSWNPAIGRGMTGEKPRQEQWNHIL